MYVILSLISRRLPAKIGQKSYQYDNTDQELRVCGVGDNVNILKIVRDEATNWICDEVGKNNFIDTLEDGRGMGEYPAKTYIIKYGRTRLHIDIYLTGEPGWIFGGTSSRIGYFCAHEVDIPATIPLAPPPPPLAKSVREAPRPSIVPIYDSVIREIANFDLSRLKKVNEKPDL